MNPIKGEMVLGLTHDGKPYSTPFHDNDPEYTGRSPDEKTRERYVIKLKERTDGDICIDSIKRDDAHTDMARAAFERGEIGDMQVEQLVHPEVIEYGGVEFRVGGPPEGKVVDKEKAMSDAYVSTFRHAEADFMRSQSVYSPAAHVNNLVRVNLHQGHLAQEVPREQAVEQGLEVTPALEAVER